MPNARTLFYELVYTLLFFFPYQRNPREKKKMQENIKATLKYSTVLTKGAFSCFVSYTQLNPI